MLHMDAMFVLDGFQAIQKYHLFHMLCTATKPKGEYFRAVNIVSLRFWHMEMVLHNNMYSERQTPSISGPMQSCCSSLELEYWEVQCASRHQNYITWTQYANGLWMDLVVMDPLPVQRAREKPNWAKNCRSWWSALQFQTSSDIMGCYAIRPHQTMKCHAPACLNQSKTHIHIATRRAWALPSTCQASTGTTSAPIARDCPDTTPRCHTSCSFQCLDRSGKLMVCRGGKFF